MKENVMYKVVKNNRNPDVKVEARLYFNSDHCLVNCSNAKIIPEDSVMSYLKGVDVEVDFEYAKNEIRRHQMEINSIIQRYGLDMSYEEAIDILNGQ